MSHLHCRVRSKIRGKFFDNFLFCTFHGRVVGCWGICVGAPESPYRVAIDACSALARVCHTPHNKTEKKRTNHAQIEFYPTQIEFQGGMQGGKWCDVWFLNRIQGGTPSFYAFRSTVVGKKMRQSGQSIPTLFKMVTFVLKTDRYVAFC